MNKTNADKKPKAVRPESKYSRVKKIATANRKAEAGQIPSYGGVIYTYTQSKGWKAGDGSRNKDFPWWAQPSQN
jgi:hypothetical protein